MADTDQFSDQQILAKTIWGEARGEGYDGMVAVANVIMNRVNSGVKWWGIDARSVCLHPSQFSCWLQSDPNRSKLMEVTDADPIYAEGLTIASNALAGLLVDTVLGSDSYYATSLSEPPKWAEGLYPVAQIGHHLFFVTAHKANPDNAFV